MELESCKRFSFFILRSLTWWRSYEQFVFLLAAGHCLLCMCLAARHVRSTRLAGLTIALCFPCLLVCFFVCTSALITCAIITSHTLLPCDLQYTSLKLMPRFGNPSVAGPEFRDKRKHRRPKRERGRLKRERGRYVSKAALRFETYVCTIPALFRRSLPLLQKILSDSRKKPSDLRKKPSGLRRRSAANAFRKGIPNRGMNFKDVYHTLVNLMAALSTGITTMSNQAQLQV